MRVAMLNNKGGVGKTLLTIGIAEAVVRTGRRVLVVDMDPQANLTRRLRATPTPAGTLTDCLQLGVRNGDAQRYITTCGWPSSKYAGMIDVLPSDLDLEDRAIEAGMPGASNRLRRALYGVDDTYDLTLIDCAPSIKGHLTVKALAALDTDGDTILCPLEPEPDAIGGALRAVRFVEDWGVELGTVAKVTGLIVNRARSTNLHGEMIDRLAVTFPGVPVLGSPIPLRAKVSELIAQARPLDDDRETAAVVETFDAIAAALLARQEMTA